MKVWLWRLAFVALLLNCARFLPAQAREGTMSDAEVETLRDAAYVPVDRIVAFEKILDTRQKRIDDLLAKRRHAGRELDLHELMDEFAAIADEFADNLEEYRSKHRDIRKALPKLVQETDRWTTALNAAPEDQTYKIVRKLALDNIKDLHDAAVAMTTEQEAYFKAHPEAEKAEKERVGNEHATHARPE